MGAHGLVISLLAWPETGVAKFDSNRPGFFIGKRTDSLFYAGMRIAQPAGGKAAAVVAPVHPAGVQPLVRRLRRARHNENRAKTARVAVVLSLFLVVLAAGLLIGGQTVINPLLQKAAERREAHRMGDIVFSMRGGLLCRHLSFDNKTAAITEGAVEPCEPDVSKANTAAAKGFAWGAR